MPITDREFRDLEKLVAVIEARQSGVLVSLSDSVLLAKDLGTQVSVMEAKIDAHEKALQVAAADMNRRLEGMNQFREENIRDKQTLVPRQEWANAHSELVKRLDEKVDSVKERLNTLDNFKWMATGIAVAISSLIGLVVHFIFSK